MKKSLLFYFLCGIPVLLFSQNVGIGTDTPSEKLDVSGNVNLTGALKVNGNAGSPGSVLTSTGTGLSWGSAMGYKKCKQFMEEGSYTFTVPAGVTEVMVELWGGGSGGTQQSGGTSGGYARTVQSVTPGYEISVTVGYGSGYGLETTGDGGNSQVTLPLGYILANGGTGVVGVGYATLPKSGAAGVSMTNTFFMYGNAGSMTQAFYSQKSATIYVIKDVFGSGGAPVGLLNTSEAPGDIIVLENGLKNTFYSRNGSHAKNPSGGGGGGNSGGGWNGAPGMVIIWYN